MTAHSLAILRFRSIADRPPADWLTSRAVSEAHFDATLDWLFKNDWRPLTVRKLVEGLTLPESLPERSFLLTFDGGCRTIVENGLPILRRYRFPAAVFVAADFVGKSAAFEGLEEPITVCTWDELELLERNDVAIQSHGLGRRRFARLDPARQEEEAVESRKALQEHARRRVDLFAYPQGDMGADPDATAAMLERAGYGAAFVLGDTVNVLPGADRWRLARISVGPETKLSALLAR